MARKPSSETGVKHAFLGNVSAIGAGGDEGGGESDGGPDGDNPGNPDAGTVDPAQIASVAAPRKRGRPKGSKARTGAKAEKEKLAVTEPEIEPPDVPSTVVAQIGAALAGIHQMLAIGLQAPEMALSEGEAQALAEAIANVGRYYVAVRTSNRMAAWGALLMTVGVIYVPRAMMIARRRAPRPEQMAS